MEGKGGCCIAKYAGSMAYQLARGGGGGGGGGDSSSSVDRIMLRYRPIAPKPASGAGGGAAPPPAPPAVERAANVERTRRRGAREGRRCRKQRKTSSETNSEGSDEYYAPAAPVVTLPLLPLTPERRDEYYSPRSSTSSSSSSSSSSPPPPMWLNGLFPRAPPQPMWSCVTVECVTDTCLEWDSHVRRSGGDEEKRQRLEADTCPAFMTDAWNCVRWVNDAYRRMVGQCGGGGGGGGVVLALVTKEKLPETRAAFSCRVRVQYTCGKERNSLTAPCDVWRLAAGGAAWRLDVDTALCLGR